MVIYKLAQYLPSMHAQGVKYLLSISTKIAKSGNLATRKHNKCIKIIRITQALHYQHCLLQAMCYLLSAHAL